MYKRQLLHKLFIRDKYDIEIAYLEGPPAKIISGADKNIKKLAWIHIELLTQKAFTEGFFNVKDTVKCYKSFNKIVCVSNSVKETFENISDIHENIEVKYNTNESEKIKKLAQEDVTDVDVYKRQAYSRHLELRWSGTKPNARLRRERTE